MKKFIKRTNIFLITALVFSFISPTYRQANASSVNIPQPVNIVVDNNASSSGYIPSGITINKSTGLYKSSSYLPSKYDLRTSAYVTPVRDQGQIGDCWAFSTYGSMESVLKKTTGISYDFSEINLSAQNGETTPDQGGNNFIATGYLTSWKGPMLETDDPYPNPATVDNINSKTGLLPRYHVQNVIYIPGRTSGTDNDTLKNAIYTYGAVSSSYYNNYDYANNGQGTAYYYSTKTNSNHAITLIGWDDTYSRNNFGTTPPGDGAFIVKNSWGTGWGDNGYFYVSYYDANLGHDLNAVFNNIESPNNYKSMYSLYDKAFYSYYPNSDNSIDIAANVYTAKSNDTISAVSFYTFTQNTPYQVYVQKVVNGQVTVPTNMLASGTMLEAGYHTVKLSSGLNVSTGDQFIVGIKLPGDRYEGTPNVSAANSYLFSGSYHETSQLAFAIDAFTSNGASADTLSIIGEDPADGNLMPSGTITMVFDDTITKGTSFADISLKNENNIEVSKNVQVSGNKLLINETPSNHIGSLKLHVPKDAVHGTRGQVLGFDYNKTYTISADSMVVHFQDPTLEAAVKNSLGIYNTDITAGDMKKLTYFSLYGESIYSLSGLQYAVNLTDLDVEQNNIIDLSPLRNLKSLESLNLNGNQVTDVSALSGLTNLLTLNLNNNRISDITPLAGLTNLTELNLSYNFIRDITIVQNLKNLDSLYLYSNYISDITPLKTFAVNATASSIYIDFGYNHIDFSAGSAASNVLSVLDTKNISYSGEYNQDAKLSPLSLNNRSPHSTITIGANERIVLTFNEEITLDSNFANLIEVNGSSNSTSDFNISVQGKNLILTPTKKLISDDTLDIYLNDGAVHSKLDTSITNSFQYYSAVTTSPLLGDTDTNGNVDILDLSNMARKYNTKLSSSSSWNPQLDIIKDGVIDIFDLSALSSYIH